MLASFRRWIGARADRYALVGSLAEIDAARRAGKLSIVFDIEGLAPFDGGDHGLLEMLAGLGVRWALIAYNRNNRSGGGCMDEDCGLTAHGRAILAEMKRVGMAVCCSHAGRRTVRDVFEHADNPVIFSHSNASAVDAHVRNIPDELIVACAGTGGVVGVNGIGTFLGGAPDSAARMAEHIDHIVQLVGPDHAGLGLDYVYDAAELDEYLRTMKETFPMDLTIGGTVGLTPPEAIASIVAGLLAKGYPEDALRKIVGGNWRRIAEKVWRDPAQHRLS